MNGLIRTDAEIAADEAQDEYESCSRVWQVRDAREHGFTLAIQAMRVLAGEAFARRERKLADLYHDAADGLEKSKCLRQLKAQNLEALANAHNAEVVRDQTRDLAATS